MENLIHFYKEKNKLLRQDAIEKIQNAENKHVGEYLFILTGKVLAFDICIREIEQMLELHKESIKM